MRVKHGAHQVVVSGGATRRVEVESGRDVLGVPAFDPQCFDELDVTLSHYGASAGKVAPTVTRHFRFDHPFQLGSMPVATDELPKSASERVRKGKIVGMELVHLIVSAPCREGDTYSPGL